MCECVCISTYVCIWVCGHAWWAQQHQRHSLAVPPTHWRCLCNSKPQQQQRQTLQQQALQQQLQRNVCISHMKVKCKQTENALKANKKLS